MRLGAHQNARFDELREDLSTSFFTKVRALKVPSRGLDSDETLMFYVVNPGVVSLFFSECLLPKKLASRAVRRIIAGDAGSRASDQASEHEELSS